MVLSISIRAWLYLVPLIPSVLVAIFDLYHLLFSQALRKGLNNHVIILLLFFGLLETLTDIIWDIYFFYNGTVLSSAPAFCTAWVFIGSTFLIINFLLMAWASIERHILVFHPNWFARKTKRFFFHYLPLATCIMWPAIFYFVMFFIVPCNYPFNYKARQCGRYSCVTASSVALMDSIANYIMPAFVTVIFSLALFSRVLYKRYRVRGRIDWKDYKKMAAQLLPISALYVFLQLPPMIVYAAYSAGLPRTVASDYYANSIFFMYWIILFTPLASVASLPDLKAKFRNLFLFWRRRHVVQAEMMEMTRRNAGQTVAVVPFVQTVKIEMTRRNIGKKVEVLPVVQPAMIETAHQNVGQIVEPLPVVQPAMIETTHQYVGHTVEPLPTVVI